MLAEERARLRLRIRSARADDVRALPPKDAGLSFRRIAHRVPEKAGSTRMMYSRRVARAFFTQTAVACAVLRAVMRPRLCKVRRARVRRAKSLTASPKSQEARR